MKASLAAILQPPPPESELWTGRYKIPWDDPDFSRRMLAEHLSQEHDLASRRLDTVTAQVEWLHRRLDEPASPRLLDIGCGPGLYLERFLRLGYDCTGIDFSPASIAHARGRLGEKVRLELEDIRAADFGTGYDIVLMLYGELNVFSPDECRDILARAHAALNPGGTLFIEPQTFEAVRRMGDSPNNWYVSGEGLAGLFSDQPHLCLMTNHWYENARTTLQLFHIIDIADSALTTYRSTTRAWTDDQLLALLAEAGFTNALLESTWPVPGDSLQLISARKS